MRPWSYSRMSTYTDCPKQFWYSYVERVPSARPPSPAASRGTAIHEKGEYYLLDKIKVYPPEYQKVSGHMMQLKAHKAIPERKMAVNQKWEPVPYDDPLAYYRGIIDVHYEARSDEGKSVHIEDFKTGQIYDSHPKQMETYVALVAAQYPKAERFITRLIYVDQGIVTPPKITEAVRLKPIRMLLDGQIEIAETDTIFPMKPSMNSCKWCDYSKKFGGPCQY